MIIGMTMMLVLCVDKLAYLDKVTKLYIIMLINTSLIIGAKARSSSYTERLKSFHIIDLHCNGAEENVFDCPHNLVQQYSCSHYEDANVQCTGNNMMYSNIMDD